MDAVESQKKHCYTEHSNLFLLSQFTWQPQTKKWNHDCFMPLIDPEWHPHSRITQPALLSIWLRDTVTPHTPYLTPTHTLTVGTVDHDAGWQADRWCADNAVSLEQRTNALRAGQQIHLVERQGGPNRMGPVKGWWGVCSRVCTDIAESHMTALILKLNFLE